MDMAVRHVGSSGDAHTAQASEDPTREGGMSSRAPTVDAARNVQARSNFPRRALSGDLHGGWNAAGHPELCLVASLLLLLTIAATVCTLLYLFMTEIVEGDDVVRRRPQLRQFYCNASFCKRFSRDIVGYIKWTSNPCLDLFRFVCGGFLEEATNDLYGAATPNDMYSRVDRHLEEKYYRDKFISYDILRRPVRNMAELMESSLGDCLLSNETRDPGGEIFTESFSDVRRFFIRFLAVMPLVHMTISMFPKNVDGTDRKRFHMFPMTPIAPQMLFNSETFKEDFKKDIPGVLLEVASFKATPDEIDEAYEVLRKLHMAMPHRKVHLPTYKNISLPQERIDTISYGSLFAYFVRTNVSKNYNVVVHHPTYLDTISKIADEDRWSAIWKAMVMYGCLHNGVRYRKPASKQLYARIRRGIYGPVSDKRNCIEAMREEAVAFQYDLMREYMHNDDLAKYLKIELLTKLLKRLALGMLHRMKIFTDAERTIAENKVKNLAVYFFYPEANLTKKEAGKYPYTTRYMNLPEEAPNYDGNFNYGIAVNLSLRAQAYLLSEENLKWLHMDPFEREPVYYGELNTLYLPPQSMQRVKESMQCLLERVMPLDMPMYAFLPAREMFHAFGFLGQNIDDKGEYRPWYSTGAKQNYEEIKSCFEDLLSSYNMNYSAYDIHDIIAETATLDPLFEEYRSQTQKKRLIHKPRAAQSFVADLPDFTSDQLFVISLASNLCERYLPRHLEILKELGMRTARTKINFLFKNWDKFGEIFNCKPTDYMVGERFCRVALPPLHKP